LAVVAGVLVLLPDVDDLLFDDPQAATTAAARSATTASTAVRAYLIEPPPQKGISAPKSIPIGGRRATWHNEPQT
jgi:hypothetical protein